MRLIDADKALEWIDTEYPKLDRQDMKQMINAQPTTYDIGEAIKQYEIGFDDGFAQASEIDLRELKKQIKDGDFRTFVNNGKVYLEDVIDGEAIMIYEFKAGEKE